MKTSCVKCVLFVLTQFICIVLTTTTVEAVSTSIDLLEKKSVATKTGFQKNLGQIVDEDFNSRPDILYKINNVEGELYIRNNGVSYVFRNQPEWNPTTAFQEETERLNIDSIQTIGFRVDIDLIDANPISKVVEVGEKEEQKNYYLGYLKSPVLGVPSFEQVTLKEVYEGIDVKHYFNGNQVEYDFLVQPFADITQIKLKISGTDQWRISDEGNLVITTPLGKIIERKPIVYQGDREIPAKYSVIGNVISFEIGEYDLAQPLRIDPIREWSTFIGGNQNEWSTSVAIDNNNNAYLLGTTESMNFPVTVGSFTGTYGTDCFVSKFSSSGNLIWSTYIGGVLYDAAHKAVVDNVGDIYVSGVSSITGTSTSNGIPITSGAFQPLHGGDMDGFLTKLTSSGTIIWSTFLGGQETDIISGIDVDANNNVFVSGVTESTNFPVTAGAYQSVKAGALIFYYDQFLMKFSPTGGCLWSTYIGGTNTELPNANSFYYIDFGFHDGVSVDQNGDVYIIGTSSSTDYPVTTGAYQTTNSGDRDGVISKFSGAGSLMWSTYIGGTVEDFLLSIDTDPMGNPVLTGNTKSLNFPVTTGALQASLSGTSDNILVKFNTTGGLLYSSYFGGSGLEFSPYIAVSSLGDIYAAGMTYSTNFYVTPDAYQGTIAGANDIYLTQFDENFSIKWSSFYGGSGSDNLGAVNVNIATVYLAGRSNSYDFPLSQNAYQTTFSGQNDATLTKFYFQEIITENNCQYDTIHFSLYDTNAIDSVLWNFGDTLPGAITTSTLLNPSHIYNNYGQYNISCFVYQGGAIDTLYDTLIINPTPIANLGNDTILCEGDSMQLLFNDTSFSYLWNTGDTIMNIPIFQPGTYWVEISSICGIDRDTIEIDSLIPALIHLPNDTLLCDADSILLDASIQSGTYAWSNGNMDSTYWATAADTFWVIATNFCGTDSDTVVIEYTHTPGIWLGNDTVLCTGDTLILDAWDTLSSYFWDSGDTTQLDTFYNSGIYHVTTTNICGSDSDTLQAWFIDPPMADLGNDTILCLGDFIWINDTAQFSDYLWSTGSSQDSIYVSQQDTYSITVTNVCGADSDSVIIYYDSNPITNLGPDSTYCITTLLKLNAEWSRAAYLWNTKDTTPTIFAGNAGQYSVQVVNLCGFDGDTVSIFYDLPIQFQLGVDTVLCLGDSLTLEAPAHNASWNWNTGSTDSVITVHSSGLYTVNAKNNCGTYSDQILITADSLPLMTSIDDTIVCFDREVEVEIDITNSSNIAWSDTVLTDYMRILDRANTYYYTLKNICGTSTDSFLLQHEYPLDFSLGNDTVLCFGQEFTRSYPYPDHIFVWDDGDTDSAKTFRYSGVYGLTIFTPHGCESYDELTIEKCQAQLFVPSAFTPDNGDMKNDYFNIYGLDISTFSIQIFDRWGNIVFESDDINHSWDGTYQGKPAPMAVYSYHIWYGSDNQSKELWGSVTLIR